MLLNLIKNSQFLQDLYIRMTCSIHPSVTHNRGKIELLQKAFLHVTTEQIPGSYFEFGVYEGSSMLAALEIHRTLSAPASVKFLKKKIERDFYGFDSFDDGFKYNDNKDIHPFFSEGDFVSSYEKCSKRLSKYSNAKLIKGYFENTVQNKLVKEVVSDNKCAILFIDCDLMSPALVALNFVKPALQAGTIVILDDYFGYKGNPSLGTCGAWAEFLAENTPIKSREFFRYGCGGNSFVVHGV